MCSVAGGSPKWDVMWPMQCPGRHGNDGGRRAAAAHQVVSAASIVRHAATTGDEPRRPPTGDVIDRDRVPRRDESRTLGFTRMIAPMDRLDDPQKGHHQERAGDQDQPVFRQDHSERHKGGDRRDQQEIGRCATVGARLAFHSLSLPVPPSSREGENLDNPTDGGKAAMHVTLPLVVSRCQSGGTGTGPMPNAGWHEQIGQKN